MVKKIAVIAQARYRATRLPGKVLKELYGKTVLGHIISRVKKSTGLNGEHCLIIATGDKPCDDAVAQEALINGADVFRGSEEDVLARFYFAAKEYCTEHILRLCCDNPFIDSRIIDAAIDYYRGNNYDYISCSNLPIGLGLEIFSFERLKTACLNAAEDYQREHVTPYIIENSGNKGIYSYERDYSKFRLTLDTPEDWLLTNEIYNRLYKRNPDFGLEEIVEILNREEGLFEINMGVIQKKAK